MIQSESRGKEKKKKTSVPVRRQAAGEILSYLEEGQPFNFIHAIN